MKEIRNLYVAEFAPGSSVTTLESESLEIRTCQRTLFVGFSDDRSLPTDLQQADPVRFFWGVHAYELLLRFTCGLESQIKGETDVFGQTKTALKNYLSHSVSRSDFDSQLDSVFQRIFEDTKEIRAQFLHGIGGNTYGTLSRRILNPQPTDQALMIGAGQITKSVAPYFSEFHLKIWNRSPDRLLDFQALPIETLTGLPALKKAFTTATMIILATPPGSEVDDLVVKHFCMPTKNLPTKILHLGGQNNELSSLAHQLSTAPSPISFFTLTDLFALEKEQFKFREKQVRQAELACHNRAKLRRLARSIHLAHGWEDLAIFS
jgi:hypothetical protein